MALSPPLAVALTVLFLATGAYAALRLASQLARRELHGHPLVEVFHAAMSIAMIAMAWGWSSTLGDRVQLAVFGAFGLYFLARLATGASGWATAQHVLMSVAMVWMVAAMPLMMPAAGSGAPAAGGGHAGHGAGGMPGMAMAPGWVTAVSTAFAIALVVAAAWWMSRALHRSDLEPDRAGGGPAAPTRTEPRLFSRRNDAICHALMSAGMAVMLVN